MRTEIYPNLEAFYQREDKTMNGTTQRFADACPDIMDEAGNEGCWSCLNCVNCIGCLECSDCTNCLNLENCRECVNFSASANRSLVLVPILTNIHQQVWAAVSQPGALNMSQWHVCSTTHCRAGWVVHLAGAAGYRLAEQLGHEDAARRIYQASDPKMVLPWNAFYRTNEKAMADMERCAMEEVEMAAKQHGDV